VDSWKQRWGQGVHEVDMVILDWVSVFSHNEYVPTIIHSLGCPACLNEFTEEKEEEWPEQSK